AVRDGRSAAADDGAHVFAATAAEHHASRDQSRIRRGHRERYGQEADGPVRLGRGTGQGGDGGGDGGCADTGAGSIAEPLAAEYQAVRGGVPESGGHRLHAVPAATD